MPKRGKREEKDAEDSASNRRKKHRPELPESDDGQLHVLKWSDLTYDIVWDIFGHLSTTQKSKYRRVSSTWNHIQLKHISTSPVLKLDYFDLKHWKTIFCPPVRETRRATCKRQIKFVTDKTRWVIMDFEDYKDPSYRSYLWHSMFNLKEASKPPLQCLTEHHPQIRNVVLSKKGLFSGSSPMSDYLFLKDLGCSSDLGPTVMVCQSELAEFPISLGLDVRRVIDEMKTLRETWPKSIKLDGEGNNYWSPLKDLYMAYWPYPPDQLQWLEECITKVPPSDGLFRFLSIVRSYGGHDAFDFHEKTAVHFHGYYRLRSVLAICASYFNIHRSRLNLPPPPHALTWSTVDYHGPGSRTVETQTTEGVGVDELLV